MPSIQSHAFGIMLLVCHFLPASTLGRHHIKKQTNAKQHILHSIQISHDTLLHKTTFPLRYLSPNKICVYVNISTFTKYMSNVLKPWANYHPAQARSPGSELFAGAHSTSAARCPTGALSRHHCSQPDLVGRRICVRYFFPHTDISKRKEAHALFL